MLLHNPLGNTALVTLNGDGADDEPTRFQLFVESGGLDVRDATRRSRPEVKKDVRSAVIDAIFRERRDPEGTGRCLLGKGEVWREEES